MNVKKTVVDSIEGIYAPCIGKRDGEPIYIGCSEDEGGAARGWTRGGMETIWDGFGGTMSFVPVPGLADAYFATQKFYPIFQSAGCTLCLVRREESGWTTREIMPFPYLHRFQLFSHGGAVYFIGATLCKSKAYQEDWSQPGSVYCGKLDMDNLERPIDCRRIHTGITKNHGMWFAQEWGENGAFLVSGTEGIFACCIPDQPDRQDWKIQQVLSHEVSDMALCDADGDGSPELMTIEPFHGDTAVLYKLHDGAFAAAASFALCDGHVVWGGNLAGEPGFLLGSREDARELNVIRWEDGRWQTHPIDAGVGPSQVSVRVDGDTTYVLAANRMINQLALYELTK